ncbi:4-hydroxy-tetrahydrodipicolinate synthase [Paenibacillus turpanensis]|uniref:4-hydroxy-tetrahydrodipicolinate synthase n=1 Tax=Paenibacillus turpanensis TaxID=2689078 RepID=UPI00140AFA23|nr:4-hydroxy-tetrahydrodipicolinate synthase [Paenibacillus turpanensis]
MDFGRLITAMVTPFDGELRIDWNQTEKLINDLIVNQHNEAIVVAGTTGESPTLTDEEKEQLFRFAVEKAAGRCKVIAGTGANDTAHSIHLTKVAEKAGVDGVLLVAPYYNRPSDEGLYRHFRAIAESTSLPIMLYNIPSRTGVNMSPELTLRLAEIPNIVATKESSGDLDQMSLIAANAPDGFRLYSGDDSLTLPLLSVGGYGIVSVAAHVVGKPMREMIDAFVGGEVTRAAQLHGKLMPVFKGLFFCPHRVPNPAPVKHALKLHGLDVGGLRLPMVEVTEAEGKFIANLFATKS